jgi:hypothetical protein
MPRRRPRSLLPFIKSTETEKFTRGLGRSSWIKIYRTTTQRFFYFIETRPTAHHMPQYVKSCGRTYLARRIPQRHLSPSLERRVGNQGLEACSYQGRCQVAHATSSVVCKRLRRPNGQANHLFMARGIEPARQQY